MSRFSKNLVDETLQKRLQSIQDTWGFDPRVGYAQVEAVATARRRELHGTDQEILHDALIAYGEYSALMQVAEDLGIQAYPDVSNQVPIRINKAYIRYMKVPA